MDSGSYRAYVATQVTDHDYEAVADEEANPFDPVWYKKDADPTIGRTKVFITVIENESIDTETIETTAEAFRTLLATASTPTAETVENLFGYVVFAVRNPSDSLIEFATEEYTVADRRTNVFPLVFDVETETLYTHTVPRLKGRGFYEKQQLDAEQLLMP